jgi:hypothetical protein
MNKHEHNQQEVQDHILVPHDHKPYWKRMHHTWSFWVFLFLMLACILYYIVSVDFAFAPHIPLK